MPDRVIRRVPRKTLDAIRKKAEKHGCSLEDELRLLTERPASEEDLRSRNGGVRRLREKIASYAPDQTDSVEIIQDLRGSLGPPRRPKERQ